MFSINLDDAFEGYVGSIFFGIGLIVFCILAFTTNYVNVGIGIGIAVVGLVSLISSIYNIYEMITTGTKSKRIIAIICATIIVISIIFSIIHPMYIQGLKISFSKAASIFAEPVIIYALISILLTSLHDEEMGKLSITMKFVTLLGGMGLGILIAGICYFTSLTPVLVFLNKNFSYEDRRLIQFRTLDYGSNEFENVFPQILKLQKEYDDRDNLEQARREKNIAKIKFEFKDGYKVYNFTKENEEHVYTLMIEDQAKYDTTGDFPKYSVKVNLETYEVLSIEKIEHKDIDEIINDLNNYKVPVVEENN